MNATQSKAHLKRLHEAAPELLDLLEGFVDAFPGEEGLETAMEMGGLDVHLVAARVLVHELRESA